METTCTLSVNNTISDETDSIENEETVVHQISDNSEKEQICRLCGNSGFNYLPIFGNDDMLIAEKISRCLPIIVLSTDDLPLHICPCCLQNLNISHKLVVTSLKMDLHLRQQLNNSKDTSDLRNGKKTKNNRAVFMDGLSTEVIYGPIKCEICCKIYVDMDEFDLHIETEHLLPWPCSLCDKSFETSVLLVDHKEHEHAGNILICTGCIDDERLSHGLTSLAEMQNSRIHVKDDKKKNKKKKNDKDLSKKTQNTADKESDVQNKTETKWLAMCDICKIAFGTEELLSAHRRIHQTNNLCCHLCQTDFTSIYELFIHKREKHNVYKRIQLKFVCETCGKFFSNNWQWLNHRQEDNCKRKTSNNRCKYCNADFAQNYKLTKHLRKHRDEMLKDPSVAIYRCVACPKIFVDKEFYEKHRNVHDPECWNKFKCDLCDRSFRDKKRLRDHHQATHEGIKPHQCDICRRRFYRASNMRAHREKHFGQKCDHCDEVLENNRLLANHIKEVHNLEPNLKLTSRRQYIVGPFVCKYCGKKLANYQTLLDHEHIHTDEKPYPCKICGESFRQYIVGPFVCKYCGKKLANYQTLLDHEHIHTDEKPYPCKICGKSFRRQYIVGPFVCKYCGKKLANYQTLLDHEHIHTDEKPYPCKICGKSFRSYTTRWSHMQRHAKTSFICEHCGKSFGCKQNLMTHMLIHSPVENRKHQCSKCEKRFMRKSHLNVHMRIHDGVRPYTCDICQFSFTQLGDMRRHHARHAKGKIRTRRQVQTHKVTAIVKDVDSV